MRASLGVCPQGRDLTAPMENLIDLEKSIIHSRGEFYKRPGRDPAGIIARAVFFEALQPGYFTRAFFACSGKKLPHRGQFAGTRERLPGATSKLPKKSYPRKHGQQGS